jgi:hypothetical protein
MATDIAEPPLIRKRVHHSQQSFGGDLQTTGPAAAAAFAPDRTPLDWPDRATSCGVAITSGHVRSTQAVAFAFTAAAAAAAADPATTSTAPLRPSLAHRQRAIEEISDFVLPEAAVSQPPISQPPLPTASPIPQAEN